MKIFVSATDTDVGKTFVSACLLRGLQDRGKNVLHYHKLVQTGPSMEDCGFVANFVGTDRVSQSFHFDLPASPDQAALHAGADELCLKGLVSTLQELGEDTLIEGAGGVCVPLNSRNETWLDVLEAWKPDRFIFVARSGLGTLNHTILSLKALATIDLIPDVIVLNGARHQGNIDTLTRMYPNLKFVAFERLDLNEADVACRKLSAEVLDFSEATSPDNIVEVASKHVWFPLTQHKSMKQPMIIKRAKGVYLYDDKGKAYVDGIGSWWVNNIGHGRPEIGELMHRQQRRLDHVIFTGAVHDQAVTLTRSLAELSALHQRVFYSDNGSTAVEVGLKMAMQYQQAKGKPNRTKIAHVKGGYHGDTFGAMAVSSSSCFHKAFESAFMDSPSISPATTHPSLFNVGGEEGLAQALKEASLLFESKADTLAAIILEPMLQGAGGMVHQQSKWLREVARMAHECGVLVIFDEVFTGVGRVGSAFAFKREELAPDIVCVSKGITGGTLPLGVTLATEGVFSAFLSDDSKDALLHGHSYTGNPISTGVANLVLDIMKNEKLYDKGLLMEKQYCEWLREISTKGIIKNTRAYGGVMAFELSQAKEGDYFSKAAIGVVEKAKENGLFIRPLGGTLYLAPPLTISNKQLKFALDVLAEALV